MAAIASMPGTRFHQLNTTTMKTFDQSYVESKMNYAMDEVKRLHPKGLRSSQWEAAVLKILADDYKGDRIGLDAESYAGIIFNQYYEG